MSGKYRKYGYRPVRDRGGLGPPERAFAYVFETEGNLLPPWTTGNQVERRLSVSYNSEAWPLPTEVTWIVPPEVETVWITGTGSGGGGSGAVVQPSLMQSGAGGGASAAVVKCPLGVSSGTSIRIMVPGGGLGGATGSDGGDGASASIFIGGTATLTAEGGYGGSAAVGADTSKGGRGGVGLTPAQNGQPGTDGTNRTGSGGVPKGGHGGNCAFGRGSPDASCPGSRGSGGSGGTPGLQADAGSRGGDGFVIIEW